MTTVLYSLRDWEDFVNKVAVELTHPLLLLKGNLGAGKTTFTQSLLRALGSSDEVSSPTYALVNQYNTPLGKVFHFDLYRLKSTQEVMDIGLEEYFGDAYLCIIEWPEIYEEELQHYPHHHMVISVQDDVRSVTFN